MAASDALSDAGIRVMEAESTDHALEILEREAEATILFTDIRMHDPCDGIALAKIVARRWPRIRIIVTSGSVSPTDTDLPGGATFLPKPYRLATLLHAVVGMMGTA
jgi:DNA-binding NtrC family response regulator